MRVLCSLEFARACVQREASVSRFRSGTTSVLVCTDVLGRGMDFKGVRLVVNYDLPTSGVSYVHRIGRTGRAGVPGERAVALLCLCVHVPLQKNVLGERSAC